MAQKYFVSIVTLAVLKNITHSMADIVRNINISKKQFLEISFYDGNFVFPS